jgi:acyl-CoA dehydrogenase
MTVALVDRDQAFLASIRRIADEVAAPNADGVDRDARFPSETIDALRAEGALAALVPAEMDGGGLRLETIATAVFELGRRCGASGMVFGMHQIQVATLIRHADGAPWFQGYLRELAREQRLIASVTSEIGTGGDIGRSIAAVTPAEDGCATFEKAAPTVSYGSYADDFLTTLRRTPEAEPGDQVLALTRRDQTTLEQNGTWDPLGMRGTCSPGFTVRAEFPTDQIMPTPFSTIAPESMVPVTHVLWSHLWLGIATDAFDRARAFVRASAKGRPEAAQPLAQRLSHLMTDLALLRAEVGSGLRDFTEASEGDRERLTTMATILRFNNLKLAASEHAPKICQGALGVTGIVGFKNDTPFSVGRHIRDSMSASLMVANERIHQTNASLLLIAKDV